MPKLVDLETAAKRAIETEGNSGLVPKETVLELVEFVQHAKTALTQSYTAMATLWLAKLEKFEEKK